MKNFVVYRSSAGSGKTFTLVKEYLRLAMHDEKKLNYNYRRILAITFTNKAAAEMKSRVISALHQISGNDEIPFLGHLLCKELNLPPEQLKERAQIVLSSILHHYSDFAIGTIDSFTHKIVKTFAHDLKLPVNFNIELDTRGFYDKVIALLFSQVGEDEYVSKLLKDFVLGKAESNSSWDPEKQIQEFSALLQKENSEAYIQKLKHFETSELESFRKQFQEFTKHYQNTLKALAEKAIQLIRSKHLSDEDFRYKKTGPQSFFKKCFNNTVLPEDTHGSRLMDALEQNKWAGSSNAAIDSISGELNRIARELIDFINENYQYYSLCNLLANQMYSLMLLKKIEEISLEQKNEERLVFISEFNQRIFDIINNEPTPFIYERLGERYQHYLLDEFQDTSSLQWQNILPLVDNSLSNGWFNLIVGDGKQSIYRWRNANVKQFALLPEIENNSHSNSIAERELSLNRNFEEKFLDTNFRSLGNIVSFNNALFAHLTKTVLLEENQKIYFRQEQKWQKELSDLGYVSIDTLKIKREEMDDYTCSQIKSHIEQALNDGFSYGDICILARKNYHGNIIAAFLMEQGIPVVSSDSLLLRNNLEVNTLLCFLNYLINNQDIISAAAVINYVHVSGGINGEQLHKALENLSRRVNLFDVLSGFGIELNAQDLSLNNLLDNCIAISTALQLNKNAFHYIRFFLDEVNEFLVLKNSNISSFFDWWHSRSQKASMIIPEGTKAVKIMTIHASKGLEFPVVIVPYCNWGIYKANDSWVNIENDKVQLPVTVVNLSKKAGESGFDKELLAEQNDQLLDNVNLLYVAFTRAVERLHILAGQSESNKQKGVNTWLEDFAKANYKQVRDNFYELGNHLNKTETREKATLSVFEINPLLFDTNKNVVKIKAAYLHNHSESEQAKQEGIKLHWLLSKIKSPKDIDSAIGSALLEGLIGATEKSSLTTKLLNIIEHPQLAHFFKPQSECRIESEIITATGELLRPDRILFEENATTLIDYKTGQRNDANYFKQLIRYEDALIAMGYKNIKKLLLYVDDMAIVELK